MSKEADTYYEKETIQITVGYTIKWKAGDKDSKEDAINLALALPINGGGVSPNGCYGAVREKVEYLQ